MPAGEKTQIMLLVPMLDQGGLERVCAYTAKLLNEEYEVHLAVFNAAGMIYDISGVDMTDLKLGAVPGRLGKLVNVAKRVMRVRALKKKFKVSLSYSFGPTANIVNVLTGGSDVKWAGIRGYGALEAKSVMRLICRKADRVVACTKVMENEICAQFKPRLTAAVYNPCNLAEIRQLSLNEPSEGIRDFLKKGGKTVVSMGRAHDVKGFWHLLKSLYLAKKQINDLKLVIIGDGDYSEYKRLSEQLGIKNDVLFTGLQKNPFAILARADIYVLTSQSEGFPNALIEALASGLACISVNCKTGPAEILHESYKECADQDRIYRCDYGILTPVFSGEKDLSPQNITPEEQIFADELANLASDSALLEHYRDLARRRASDFGAEAYHQNIIGLIQEDISGRALI